MSTTIDRTLTPFVILGETYYVTKMSMGERWADLHLKIYSSLSYCEKQEIRRREQVEKKKPNELERLKRAEEAGPMAVMVMDMPQNCTECKLNSICLAHVYWRDSCLLHLAIGIIEPGGHVVYLREGEE